MFLIFYDEKSIKSEVSEDISSLDSKEYSDDDDFEKSAEDIVTNTAMQKASKILQEANVNITNTDGNAIAPREQNLERLEKDGQDLTK